MRNDDERGVLWQCARECLRCAAVMGDYFCGVCNLFDNEGARKKIFHCDACGICRYG
jgi:RING finger and CHY zinc finger domain-containing protein 1